MVSIPCSGAHRGIQPPASSCRALCVCVGLTGFRARSKLLQHHGSRASQGEAIHKTDNESSYLIRHPFPVVIYTNSQLLILVNQARWVHAGQSTWQKTSCSSWHLRVITRRDRGVQKNSLRADAKKRGAFLFGIDWTVFWSLSALGSWKSK